MPAHTAARPVRRVLVFTIVAFALSRMSVDSTIVATALDSLQRGLGTSINWAGWTVTACSLGFVPMLPISGKLAALRAARSLNEGGRNLEQKAPGSRLCAATG